MARLDTVKAPQKHCFQSNLRQRGHATKPRVFSKGTLKPFAGLARSVVGLGHGFGAQCGGLLPPRGAEIFFSHGGALLVGVVVAVVVVVVVVVIVQFFPSQPVRFTCAHSAFMITVLV